ncbi:DUF1648 domain-containing protein [Flavobacterium sp. SUN046]|uniref:DUF1648 domain-containing protein n=1 Tax=Flavobacterium sp. SUN046 TaxID=3002440 RepID=UPI002DB768D7|nr:DUF1648 domain-containing protein [Flavobacterium sp. SUN046]MEC4048410.1 DUF1648 domain-containing protein [Flavobacterium sp. SUN046]
MESRPKIKIPLTPLDYSVELLGVFLFLGIWIVTITNYKTLPEIIPSHFKADGTVDGHGPKELIYSLPGVASIIYIALTILCRLPHLFNYSEVITIENAYQKYTLSSRLMRYLKSVVLIVFYILTYITIQSATNNVIGLPFWFLSLAIFMIIVPLFFYVINLTKSK